MKIFFRITIILFCSLHIAWGQLRFNRITIDNGLPQNTVRSIIQDREGYMWFATQDGLARYNGFESKIFRHSPDEGTSISSSQINCVFEDGFGIVWASTEKGGIERFNKANESFTHIHLPLSYHETDIHWIYQTPSNSDSLLWVVTDKHGYSYNTISGKWSTQYDHVELPKMFKRPNSKFINDFILNNSELYFPIINNITDSAISIIKDSSENTVWLGSKNRGLYKFDRLHRQNQSSSESNDDYTITHCTFNPDDLSTIGDNTIMCLYEDRSGAIWVGSFTGGVSVYRKWKNKFNAYYSTPNKEQGFKDTYVRALYVDRNNSIWLGGTSYGLWQFDRKSQFFTNFTVQQSQLSRLGNSVRFITSDHSGQLWVGSDNELFLFDKVTNRLVFASTMYPNIPSSLRSVWPIFEDQDSVSMWFASASTLFQFNQNNKTLIEHPIHANSIDNTFNTYTIVKDDSNYFWLGSYNNGLIKYDWKTNTVIRQWLHDENKLNSITSNRVYHLYIDGYGTLWIATDGGGLNRLAKNDTSMTHFTMKDGLPSNMLY